MSTNNSNSASIGLPAILGIVFIVLKLCKVITWSWWWVTAPFWLVPTIMIIVLMIIWTIRYFRLKKLRR